MIDDIFGYELCFPGGISGSTEILCPHCGVELTVPVEDPLGQDSFSCGECSGEFDVDWAEQTIVPRTTINLELTVSVDIAEPEEQVLTVNIAQQFLAQPDSVDLWTFTQLNDDAAAVLADCHGELALDGLTRLSDAAAAALSHHRDLLSLTSLEGLSETAAGALSKHRGHCLFLSAPAALSEAAARALTAYPGQLEMDLHKDGSPVYSENITNILKQHPSLAD